MNNWEVISKYYQHNLHNKFHFYIQYMGEHSLYFLKYYIKYKLIYIYIFYIQKLPTQISEESPY